MSHMLGYRCGKKKKKTFGPKSSKHDGLTRPKYEFKLTLFQSCNAKLAWQNCTN